MPDFLPAKTRHRIILFRIDISLSEVAVRNNKSDYECTRGVWRISETRARNAEYALGVANCKVRAVYKIQTWQKAGTAKYKFRPRKSINKPERWEFVGKTASPEIRNMYMNKCVQYWGQSPFLYVNA